MATKARIPGNAKIEYTSDLSTGAPVTVGTGGAAAAATTVPVTATTVAIPAGATIYFGSAGKWITTTAAATVGAVSLTVSPIVTPLVAGDVGTFYNYVKISEAMTIGIPTPNAAKLEASNLDSVNFNMEHISGWTDNGDVAVEANWVGDVSQTALFDLFNARTDLGWRLTVANRGTGDVSGFSYSWRGGLLRCANSPIDPKGIIHLMLLANCNGPVRTGAPLLP